MQSLKQLGDGLTTRGVTTREHCEDQATGSKEVIKESSGEGGIEIRHGQTKI
jgi:hypothetical protein